MPTCFLRHLEHAPDARPLAVRNDVGNCRVVVAAEVRHAPRKRTAIPAEHAERDAGLRKKPLDLRPVLDKEREVRARLKLVRELLEVVASVPLLDDSHLREHVPGIAHAGANPADEDVLVVDVVAIGNDDENAPVPHVLPPRVHHAADALLYGDQPLLGKRGDCGLRNANRDAQ